MTRTEAETAFLAALGEVAPEADLSALGRDAALQDELDIDSMDFLNVIVALSESTGVDVPERDYPKLATLDSCVDYLVARSGG